MCCLANSGAEEKKAADQVCHDNSVIHERILTHAQGKLQSTGGLTR